MAEETRVCKVCGKEKDIAYFCRKHIGHSNGYTTVRLCTSCESKRKKAKLVKNKKAAPKDEACIETLETDYKDETGREIRICKKCHGKKPKEEYRIDHVNWRKRICKECEGQDLKEWCSNNQEVVKKIRRSSTIRRYGLTLENYERMERKQGGVCAICKQVETVDKGRGVISLSVDHCHTTGVVRGLLCYRCNGAIGIIEKKENWLIRAKKYLDKAKRHRPAEECNIPEKDYLAKHQTECQADLLDDMG